MSTPSALLDELAVHLQRVDQDPTIQLDTGLLDKCRLLTSTLDYKDHVWKETRPLFLQTAALLPKLQQDPSPLTHLVTKLSEPYRFEDIKEVDLESGLGLQAVPFHNLILTLIEKAATNSIDAQALANRPTLVASIVRLWLCTRDAGIATQAEELLTSLLRVSKNEPAAMNAQSPLHTYGAGPMWRRLFGDRDIASLYYHYTSLKPLSSSPLPLLDKRDKTIAQARLLAWLPRVGAMDWASIASSHRLDIERDVGLDESQGLLHYAAHKMVEVQDDLLMHMTLINFFSTLITTVKTKPRLAHCDSSLALDFLKEQDIHKSIVHSYVADGSDFELSFLRSRTAQYISDYATNYPQNFESSPEMPVIRNLVHRNIRKCEASDLGIIASMPRSTLVPRRTSGLAWDECVILDMPITRTNQDALKTLAMVFHGPPKEDVVYPEAERLDSDLRHTQVEAFFARLLMALFYTKKPTMFSDIVTHMETIAMKDNAIAALALVRAIITASWSTEPLPDMIPANDPTLIRLGAFPKTGLDLILDSSISQGVLPSLLKPATTFSNLVGGRGDAENAAYQVAMAKFDVLKVLEKRLEEDGRQAILSMIRSRISEGPWGTGGSTGSRIGTLEL